MQLSNNQLEDITRIITDAQFSINEIAKGLTVSVNIPSPASLHEQQLKQCERIIEAACLYLKIEVDQFLSESKLRQLVEARMYIAVYIRSRYSALILQDVADLMKRNHAVILYYEKKFRDLYESSRQFSTNYNMLKQHLDGVFN